MWDVLTARRQYPRSHKQRGVLLVSALIMVIVFGALLTMWAQRESTATRVERARSIGDALAVLGNALDDYIKNNHKAIVQNTAIRSGGNGKVIISNPRDISAKDLIAYMALRGVGDRPPHMLKGEYQIKITVSSTVASDAPGSPRRVTALLYIDAPVQHRGRTDPVMAKIAAKQIGRHGGVTDAANPDVVTFNDSTNIVPVPVANPIKKKGPSGESIAGILVRRAGDVLSSSNEDYLPRNGSLPMTGTLDLGTQDIKKVGKFESDGVMWLKGGDNSKGGARLGLWVGNWNGETPEQPARGIMASGSITSLGTLSGVTAAIGKDKTKTTITGDSLETSYVWARNARNEQPTNMASPGWRAGDVYASEAIRAGGNIHTDGHLRVQKGLIVGYTANEKFGNDGDLWVKESLRSKNVVASNELRPGDDSKKDVGDKCALDSPHFIRSANRILACQNGVYGEIGGGSFSCDKKKIVLPEFAGHGGMRGKNKGTERCADTVPLKPQLTKFLFDSDIGIFRANPETGTLRLGKFYMCAITDYGSQVVRDDRTKVGARLELDRNNQEWSLALDLRGYPQLFTGLEVGCLGPLE